MKYKLWSKKAQSALHLLLDIYTKPVGSYEFDFFCPLCSTLRGTKKIPPHNICGRCPWMVVTGRTCQYWSIDISDLRFYKTRKSVAEANAWLSIQNHDKQEFISMLIQRIQMLRAWIAIWETANIRHDMTTAKEAIKAQRSMHAN